MATEAWDALSLPPWDECSRTEFRKAFPAANVVDCRKKMVIEQVGAIGLGEVGEADFYLHEAGKAKVLLFRARKHCLPAAPMFISDEYILLDEPCAGYLVVDKAGRELYQIPKLWFPYLTTNKEGTFFAAYERIDSVFHPFEGTRKIRVKVFRSEDGKKIFECHWDLAADDSINDGRVTLSDDGSRVALLRGRKILVFALPSSHGK